MKKIFATLLIALCTFGICSAQDLEKVTETFNSAATALDAGNKADAIMLFEQALTGATALGEAGSEVAAQCKDILPKVCLSLGKDLAKDKDFDGAMAQFNKASELAGKYNVADVADEIKEVKSQVMTAQAASLISAKDFAKVIEICNTALASDPANGTAALFLGMALSNTGKANEAVAAFQQAMENGEQEKASKQLSTTYLKMAAACQKAKDFKGCLENAQMSAQYADNPQAQKLIGTSATVLKQYKVAVDAFEAYLAMSPNAKDKAQILYQLGDATMKAGDNAKACGYFKQIAQDAKFGETARYYITTLKCN
ncbi:MAG: tetratricopeptide repeat protein [Bacteroidales bacterium]|nr:tetratricopeptide repeat protein [Candidatus Cacconaster equi]